MLKRMSVKQATTMMLLGLETRVITNWSDRSTQVYFGNGVKNKIFERTDTNEIMEFDPKVFVQLFEGKEFEIADEDIIL